MSRNFSGWSSTVQKTTVAVPVPVVDPEQKQKVSKVIKEEFRRLGWPRSWSPDYQPNHRRQHSRGVVFVR